MDLTPYQQEYLNRLRQTITCVDPALLFDNRRQERCMLPHCQKPLAPRRRRFCSEECGLWWSANHDWNQASYYASEQNRKVNYIEVEKHITIRNPETGLYDFDHTYMITLECCSRCKKPVQNYGVPGYESTRLEVDHIIPLNGSYRGKSCLNHQDNLRVVCHTCHLELTKEQRAAGLITSRKKQNNE